MKIKLLLQSISPLFILAFIQNINLKIHCRGVYIGHKQVVINNIAALFFFILIVVSFMFFLSFNRFKSKGLELPETITRIENINDNNLMFFVTYILPLSVMDLNTAKGVAVFFTLILFIVVLLLKTNLYYANPVLVMFGYNVYKCSTAKKTDVIIIIKGKAEKNDKVHFKPITEELIYYSKKARKEI